MVYVASLLVAFLFGGMLLFSVGFGTLSFKFLEPAVARKFIRKAFPFFYGYVLSVSALVCLLSFTISMTATVLAFFYFCDHTSNQHFSYACHKQSIRYEAET